MDEAREAEIRALAARFMSGTKHRRIGLVLVDLLAEIDLLRGEHEEPHMTFTEAEALIRNVTESGYLAEAQRGARTFVWRDAALAAASQYGDSNVARTWHRKTAAAAKRGLRRGPAI